MVAFFMLKCKGNHPSILPDFEGVHPKKIAEILQKALYDRYTVVYTIPSVLILV